MTKKAPARRRRKPITLPAPAGLAVAFKLLMESDHTNIAARLYAERYYPHALALIETVNTEGDASSAVAAVIKQATKAAHGHCFDDDEIAHTPELTGNVALHIGFAACWLLMADITGRGGAR